MAFLRGLTVELTLLLGWRSAAVEPARLLLDYHAISGKTHLRASGGAAVRLVPVLGGLDFYTTPKHHVSKLAYTV